MLTDRFHYILFLGGRGVDSISLLWHFIAVRFHYYAILSSRNLLKKPYNTLMLFPVPWGDSNKMAVDKADWILEGRGHAHISLK